MNFLTTLVQQVQQVQQTQQSNIQLQFDPMAFVHNLKYMGIGMLVIFAVIGLIILTTKLVNYLFSE